MTLKKLKGKQDARTTFVEHDDGRFIRSAYVVGNEEQGSIVIMDKSGNRLALINIMHSSHEEGGGPLMIDVIDVDNAWEERSALTFRDHCRQCLELGESHIVASHFAGRKR